MAENEVNITAPHELRREEETNTLELLDGFYHLIGAVTHKSEARIRQTDGYFIKATERPMTERAVRAKLIEKFRKIPKIDTFARKEIIAEAHERDEILCQFMTQGEVAVNLSYKNENLGFQKAPFTRLHPVDVEKNEVANDLPTIFLIPGIANDLGSIGVLARELAINRNVVLVAQPDSQMGEITHQFVDAATEEKNLTIYADFFEKALRNLIAPEDKIEFWGHSMGGQLIFELLNRPELRDRTSQAVILCPSGSANISRSELNIALLREMGNLIKAGIKSDLVKFSLVMGRKSPQNDAQSALKKKVMNTNLDLVLSYSDVWRTARVAEGGKIIVVTGGEDKMTRSAEFFANPNRDPSQVNSQIQVINLPQGSHATPGVRPDEVINIVSKVV